jgi:hypothetical protein
MSIPEIMGALSDWDLSVSHEQLVKPSQDFVTAIYNACLEQVTYISHQSLIQPTQNALNSLEDPISDIYALSLSHNILLHHLYATSFLLKNISNLVTGPASQHQPVSLTLARKTYHSPIRNVPAQFSLLLSTLSSSQNNANHSSHVFVKNPSKQSKNARLCQMNWPRSR